MTKWHDVLTRKRKGKKFGRNGGPEGPVG